ncbi:MAG: hypothetical protein DRJ40_10285 [Thermoprotei archaeon]|nr:MAG: hypothetical protein DRJ40_10285 [Thermoprotei archaeon]
MVRIVYATFMNYVFSFVEAVISFLFVVLIIRRLSFSDFANWILITTYISYVLFLAAICDYWIPRYVARGVNVSKTGIVLMLLLGLAATAVYSVVGYALALTFGHDIVATLLASFIVLLIFLNRGLNSIVIGTKPQFATLCLLVQRATQLAVAVLMVYYLRFGVRGVVVAAIAGWCASCMVLYSITRKYISESKINYEIMVLWIKRAWIPLYTSISGTLMALDYTVMRYITGSDEVIALYGAGATFTKAIALTAQAMPALYAGMLKDARGEYLYHALWAMYLVAIPLTTFIYFNSKLIAALLGVKYVKLGPVLPLFATMYIVYITHTAITAVFTGLERRELGTVSSRELLKTALFKNPTVNAVVNVAYLATLALTVMFVRELGVFTVVLLWVLLSTTRYLVQIVLKEYLLRKDFKFRTNYLLISKYLAKFTLLSVLCCLVVNLIPVEYSTSIWKITHSLLMRGIPYTLLYVSITYLVDARFRLLCLRAVNILIPSKIHR